MISIAFNSNSSNNPLVVLSSEQVIDVIALCTCVFIVFILLTHWNNSPHFYVLKGKNAAQLTTSICKAKTRPQESARMQDLASFSRVNLKEKLKDKTKTSHGKH